MIRRKLAYFALTLCLALPLHAQSDSVESFFTGKEVMVKLDMPGTQKGVDLKFSSPTPMNWNDYTSRIKQNGIAIHKGDTARITRVVVKKDLIEFQLDGGGFGTVRDDTNTTVSPTVLGKSDYEKSLEDQIANSTDPDQIRSLQRTLDRERARRERQNAANQDAAQVASQIKSQQVADNRLQGGSRFNLRWQGSIPSDALNPDAITRLLADYVDFSPHTAVPPGAPPAGGDPGSPETQLRRGMSLNDVAAILGQGKLISESTSPEGLKTQIFAFDTQQHHVEVTSVDSVVVRYTIASK